MLRPGRYLKPILGGDTEGTGKAVVIEVIQFADKLWYRDGQSATLYDLEKHQLDETTMVPENREQPLVDFDYTLPISQADEDVNFPERLLMIKLIKEVAAGLIAYEAVRGNDELLAPLKQQAGELLLLSESYLEVPHQP